VPRFLDEARDDDRRREDRKYALHLEPPSTHVDRRADPMPVVRPMRGLLPQPGGFEGFVYPAL
jgi:hypothetical protein